MGKYATWLVAIAVAAAGWIGVSSTAAAQPSWEQGAPPSGQGQGQQGQAAPAASGSEQGQPAAGQPAGETTPEPTNGPSTAPEGMWAGGGLNTGAFRGPFGFAGLRAEFGLPLKDIGPGKLEVALPLSLALRSGIQGLFIVPEIQYEIDLKLNIPQRLSVVPIAGLGFALWFTGQTDATLTIPLGVAARFTFTNGLYVEAMPVGTSFDIGLTSNFVDRFFMLYHFWACVGYRWP